MLSKIKKAVSYLLPPVITAGLCWVLYGNMDLRQLRVAAGNCSPWFVALFCAVSVAAMVCRGLRWRLQLRAGGINPPLGVMNRSVFGTYAVNIVFPRLGEFWRCAYIARSQSAEFSKVFGTMVADRLADTLMVALICLATLVFSRSAMSKFLESASIPTGFLSGWAFWILAGVCLLALIYVICGRDGFARRVRAFVLKTWGGFMLIFQMPGKRHWLLLTLGIWGSYIASMAFSMMAYPPTAGLVPDAVMMTFVFGSLAMAIPSNGGIGPWQFAVILSLSGIYGLPSETALIFATLNLGANTLLNILLGLYTFVHILIKKD